MKCTGKLDPCFGKNGFIENTRNMKLKKHWKSLDPLQWNVYSQQENAREGLEVIGSDLNG